MLPEDVLSSAAFLLRHDYVPISSHNHAAAHVPANGNGAVSASDDGLPGGAGLLQQAGEFLRQGFVFGQGAGDLFAQGFAECLVIRQGGDSLRHLLHVLLAAQFVPQGFGLVEAPFTGFFAEFFGRFLPGEFDAFDEVG
jgi:hypothetical protein